MKTSAESPQKISVCMATRNGDRYVGEQLASILSQLQSEDELIISDDSSVDHTVEIVKQIDDCRIRLLTGNTFYSPVFNFENALKYASGEIIILSDQDDIWLENKVKLIRESFRRSRSLVHLVVLDGSVVDAAGMVIEPSLFAKVHVGKGLLKNIYDNTYMGCCMAFSRPLLEIALPFPRRIPMHDMWLGLLAELFGDVEFIAEPTIHYRRHMMSFTDYRRRFMPMVQIGRRFFLCWALAQRYVAHKTKGHIRING